jgi:hypothetical protein
MQDENIRQDHQGAALPSFPDYHPTRPMVGHRVSEKSAVILGSVGTAVSFGLGPATVFFFASATHEWFWSMFWGPLMYGVIGVTLGCIALSINKKRVPPGKTTSGRILGMVSVTGGGFGLTLFAFYLMIFGATIAASHL